MSGASIRSLCRSSRWSSRSDVTSRMSGRSSARRTSSPRTPRGRAPRARSIASCTDPSSPSRSSAAAPIESTSRSADAASPPTSADANPRAAASVSSVGSDSSTMRVGADGADWRTARRAPMWRAVPPRRRRVRRARAPRHPPPRRRSTAPVATTPWSRAPSIGSPAASSRAVAPARPAKRPASSPSTSRCRPTRIHSSVVAVGEASEREGDRALLEHARAPGGVRRTRQRDEVPPADAAGLDRHDEPVVGRRTGTRAGAAAGTEPAVPPLLVPPLLMLPVREPGSRLPVREELLLGGGRAPRTRRPRGRGSRARPRRRASARAGAR